jgi:hypothetical protein
VSDSNPFSIASKTSCALRVFLPSFISLIAADLSALLKLGPEGFSIRILFNTSGGASLSDSNTS